MNRLRSRRPALAAAAIVGCVAAAGSIPTGTARADSSGYYEAVAKAVGAGYTLSNETIPLGLVFEGVGPEADARQTSLQRADANAAVPYLGDTIPGLPGTAAGIFGVPVPSYPLIASTGYGEPPAEVDYPGISMYCESTTASTIARSSIGSPTSGSSASARIDRADDGSVTAHSGSELNALKLGNQLLVSGVQSRAVTTADSSGALTRSSSLSVGRISAPGLSFTIPRSTPGEVPVPVPVPGVPNVPPIPLAPVPVPLGGETVVQPDIGFVNGTFTITLPFAGKTQSYALPAEPVIAAFKQLGITITYQAAQQIPNGVIAPVLSFAYTIPAPPENQYYQGPTPVTFSIGHSLSAVEFRTAGSATGAGSPAVGTDGTNATDGIATQGGSLPATAPSSGAVPGLDAVAKLFPSPAVPAQVAAESVPVDQIALSSRGAIAGADISSIYLVIVVGGLLAFLAVTALRLMGVRFRWGS
jgi:hypothetical protein